MKDTGQKSGSGCTENQEVDRWKRILLSNFTGTFKMHVFLAFLLSCMAQSSGFNEGKQASCHVDSEVDLKEWRLTCQFQKDLRESKQDFHVYRITHEGPPDLVVYGKWIENEPAVYTADGYTHDGAVSDKVVIRMKNNVVHHGEIYVCVIPPVNLQDVKTCQVPKTEEPHSTPRMTTQVWAPITNKRSGLVALKELLVLTLTIIIYENFWHYSC